MTRPDCRVAIALSALGHGSAHSRRTTDAHDQVVVPQPPAAALTSPRAR